MKATIDWNEVPSLRETADLSSRLSRVNFNYLSPNAKLLNSIELGVWTLGLQLAPHRLANEKATVCQWSTAGCRVSCINTAGRGIFDNVQQARIRRTQEFLRAPVKFIGRLHRDIEKALGIANQVDLKLAIRLNCFSDVRWEKWNVFKAWQNEVRFYDYTKAPLSLRHGAVEQGCYINYSLSEHWLSVARAAEWRTIGVNCVVPFHVDNYKTSPLPKTFQVGYEAFPVIDGDKHDCRFLDPQGVIVGLRAKGQGRHDTTGFIR